nr:putative reverse transcriptase domain-containing protein [Tanacetum cinerariifolium]
MESAHDMSGCSIDQKVKYTDGSFLGKVLTWWNSQICTLSREVAVTTSWNDFKFMMIQEFCHSHEIQKLESELWNHVMVGLAMLRILIGFMSWIEAHSSPFFIHSGSTEMYGDLKQHFWWNGMKRDIATFPLDIPVWKWDEISMDFVTGLPRTQKKNDAIWVVVDRLTKSAHFLPIRKDFSISRLADIFQLEIVRLHGTPAAIVFDSSLYSLFQAYF